MLEWLFLITIGVSNAYFVLDNNGSLYQRAEAQEACRAVNSELASIHSNDDRVEIEELLTNDGIRTVWFGLERATDPGRANHDQGPFYWSDGTPFDYEHWYHGDSYHQYSRLGYYYDYGENRCGVFVYDADGYYFYYYYPCVAPGGPLPAVCNGQPSTAIEYCCTSNIPNKVKYFYKCASKTTEHECLAAIDRKDTKKPKCKWIDCKFAGYCKFNGVDDVINRHKKKICGGIDNEVDCMGTNDFCLWQHGIPSLDEYDEYEEEEEFMIENGYFMIENGYNNTLLLLFILFSCLIFICYQIYNKCISSSSKLKNEYEPLI